MSERAKGGPLAKLVGMWCKEPAFWVFLSRRFGQPVTDDQTAAEVVRRVCGVASRAELDSAGKAEATFHVRVRLPYMRWMQGVKRWEC